MDGGAWWATVHGVAKSQTRLSNFACVYYLSLVWYMCTMEYYSAIKRNACESVLMK